MFFSLLHQKTRDIGWNPSPDVVNEPPGRHGSFPMRERAIKVFVNLSHQLRLGQFIRRVDLKDTAIRKEKSITLPVPNGTVGTDRHEVRRRLFDYLLEEALKLRW